MSIVIVTTSFPWRFSSIHFNEAPPFLRRLLSSRSPGLCHCHSWHPPYVWHCHHSWSTESPQHGEHHMWLVFLPHLVLLLISFCHCFLSSWPPKPRALQAAQVLFSFLTFIQDCWPDNATRSFHRCLEPSIRNTHIDPFHLHKKCSVCPIYVSRTSIHPLLNSQSTAAAPAQSVSFYSFLPVDPCSVNGSTIHSIPVAATVMSIISLDSWRSFVNDPQSYFWALQFTLQC